MKEYNFTIEILDGPAKGEFVFIDLSSPGWDEFFVKEKFIGIFSFLVQEYLSTSYCMYGKLFEIKKHSPRQLYEALSTNNEYAVIVDGEVPDGDEECEDEIPGDAIH